MPNREIIQQWVDALRSGEYTQTRGKLHRVKTSEISGAGVGMCCLGVLCDLAAKAGVVEPFVYDDVMRYDEEVYILPRRVYEWAGLLRGNPEVRHTVLFGDDAEPTEGTDAVTILNDDFGLGFEAIADAIEQTYLVKSDAGQPA